MRSTPILCAVFLAAATPALAQVTVDLHALQALPERPAHSAARNEAPRTEIVHSTPTHTTIARQEAPAPPPATSAPAISAPPAQQPALPQNAPQTASINPIAPPEPPAGAAPPPPPAISDKAATVAAPTTAGLRLTFSPDQSDLNPDSAASIKHLAATAPSSDDTTFNVLAYAPGKSDDPSTARRLSLSRAMAVRNALIADGVPSPRIFVRALGEQYGDGPPNRVDISVTGVNASANAASAR